MIKAETVSVATVDSLAPYVPRVALQWLREAPERRRRSLAGTMAFVDVSGFTAMSERLAPKGRLGAEEVTDVMSATFTRLLAVAYEHGGGLVKFGGDALLLFFDGDEHARRACHAADGMRSTLAAIGSLETSVGAVELRMHVGVHSGTFDFFLAGATHRELIVAGAGAAETVAMEDAAEAGEILVSAEVAAQLPAASVGAAKGGGFLLAAAPHVTAAGIAPLPDVAGLDLAECIPVALRAHLAADRVDSEHRRAAVAFVRFSGLARLLGSPDDATDAVAEVVAALQEAADEHGVCFLESDIDAAGGRVVLVAGVPTTSGDDEERLLRTVRAAVDAETRLPLHVGVAAGNVFAGRIGPPYRRTFTILGGTAALAARLMAKAPGRAIWTTPDVVERSKTLFEVAHLEPLQLKGKAEPVAAVSVGARGGARVATTSSLPLVDRQRELPVLEASLVPVKLGYGSFVELVGPAGIGKSRLLEEVCARGELPIVAAECEQYEATTPYSAFRKLLSPLLASDFDPAAGAEANTRLLEDMVAAIDRELLPWLPLLGDVLDLELVPTRQTEELQPAFRRARLHGVVEELLTRLLEGPTLLLFEDTHWMDEASSELLRHLGSRVPTKPWLICATRRSGAGGFVAAEGTPPIPALTLVLDPIPEDDAKQLAFSAAAETLPAEELAAIVERAGGNPLFVRELVATRSDAGDSLPGSVEEVVTVRIDNLASPDRALLRWASVLGVTFSGELVAAVLEGDPDAGLDSESWDRLSEFVERDPYVAGAFRFRHALIRDAAYDGLPFRRRRELHARAGEVIRAAAADEADVAETLALHFRLAERLDETWRYSLIAAERAKSKFANVDAAELYRRALVAAEHLPTLTRLEVGDAWEALGDVLELSGDYVEARRAYRRARASVAGDAEKLAGLALKEGRLRENEGRYAQALRWYTRGLRDLDSLEPSQRSAHRLRLSLGYAGARYRQGMVDDCIAWVQRVIEEARAISASAELAHAYYLLHLAYTSVGADERTQVRDLALPIYEELGDLLGQANTLNNLGIDAYYEGRWSDALTFYERSRDARRRVGDVVGAAIADNNIAEILSDQGRLDEAEQRFEHVHSTCVEAGSRLMAGVATSNLGRVAARAGRHEEAQTLLSDALIALLEIEAGSFVVETEARLAEAALLRDDVDSALAAVDLANAGPAAASPAVQALLLRVKGCALARLGQTDDARVVLDESLAVARAADVLYDVALTLDARARVFGDADAAGDAAAIFAQLGVLHTP